MPKTHILASSIAEIDTVSSVFDSHTSDLSAYVSFLEEASGYLNGLKSKTVAEVKLQISGLFLPHAAKIRSCLYALNSQLLPLKTQLQEISTSAKHVLAQTSDQLEVIRLSYQELNQVVNHLGPSYYQYLSNRWDEVPQQVLPVLDSAGVSDILDSAYTIENAWRNKWVYRAEKWVQALQKIFSYKNQWEALLNDRADAEKSLISAIDDVLKEIKSTQLTGSKEDFFVTNAALMSTSFGVTANKNLLTEKIFLQLLNRGNDPQASFKVKNALARKALKFALHDPVKSYEVLGFTGSLYSFEQFQKEIRALENTLIDAENSFSELGFENYPVSLLNFRNHDDYLTAAISFGDLDRAHNIGVAVSGMTSTVGNMQDTLPGVLNVYKMSQTINPAQETATVHWIGYNAPGPAWYGDLSVFDTKRASSGAIELADFIDQIHATRKADGNSTEINVTVFAHSYGSTTAAEALKISKNGINNLVTVGSAGFETKTDLADIKAKNIYSTTASYDKVAPFGVSASGRVDPRKLENVNSFHAETTDGTKRVTSHSFYLEPGLRKGYLSEGTNSLKTVSRLVSGMQGI